MTSVTIGPAATVSPVEQSAHTAAQTPTSTAIAPTGAPTVKASISYPNPSLRLDYQLGLVVIEFRDASGQITRTIPNAQQLAAYQQWSETGAGSNPLAASLVPTAATGSTASPHQVGIPLTGAASGSGTGTGGDAGSGNAPATTPSGTAATGATPPTPTPTPITPIGGSTIPTVAPVGGSTDSSAPSTTTSAPTPPPVAPTPVPTAPVPTTTVAADLPAH